MIRQCLSLVAFLGAISMGDFARVSAADKTPKPPAAGLSVSQAWARATPGVSTIGAAYLTIKGHSKADDKLLSVKTSISRRVELHTHVMDNDVMRMRQKKSVAIPAGKTIVLKPGSDHVMLFDLEAPLRKGAKFDLVLQFENAGLVAVSAGVLKIGSMGPDKIGKVEMGHGETSQQMHQSMKNHRGSGSHSRGSHN